jgi:membrane-associated protein
MQGLVELWHRLSDLQGLIQWGGYIALTGIVFAETGLLVGFFLPGDSLLVTAGLLASQGILNVYVMGALLTVAAVVGQSLGYAIGKAAGARLFTREDSLLFKRSHLLRAHEFYERHGGKTVVIARFMPIVRTFVPVVAGAAEMRYRDFTIYNVVGGVLWVWSMLLIGYVLGRYIPGVEKHIDLVIALVVLLSISPGILTWLRRRRASRVSANTVVVGPRTTLSEE